MRSWLIYALVRLGVFVVTLGVLLLVGAGWIPGAIFATLIALVISIMFLGPLRERVARDMQHRVEKPTREADAEIEDSQIDDASN